jgi:uncharacterized protein with HEPN domain
MHADARKLLWDARRAAERACTFTRGKAFDDYRADDMLRSAVERQLEIIGEALNRLSRVDPETARAIPELGRIVGFRNILVHGYASVDDRIVWGIVDAQLGPLLGRLDSLLAAP